MANMNKVILIGRLTRDVETKMFSNGGMVAKFGFAVTNRKKNTQTGQWEDEPMFIDCEAYNRGDMGKLADRIKDGCRKGSQIMIEGKLHLDQWNDKTTGDKRSKHKIIVDNVQFLDPRQDNMGGGAGMDDDMGGSAPAPRSYSKPNSPTKGYSPPPDDGPEDGENIPF
ncbi:MAG: single-stranded DNA-binding protein [Fimbriiglobus sp.]